MRKLKNLFYGLLFGAALALGVNVAAAADPIVQNLQDVSVTIKAAGGQGSGVLYTRKVGDDTVTFVWTAAHVVDSLRSTRSVIDPKSGTARTVVEFADAQVVREFSEDGRRIGEMKFDARVILYSDADTGEDLALLQIRKKNYVADGVTVKFYLDDKIPDIGTDLYHVGSLRGQFGSNSLTTGLVSQIGRVLELNPNGVVFDQTTVTAFPGSSGGGVFLKSDGRYVGMLVRGAGETFNFIVPARRIHAWVERNKVEWAIDPNVPMPTLEELSKLKPDDSGVTFNDKAAAEKRIENSKNFPFLMLPVSK